METLHATDIWQKTLNALRPSIDKNAFETWLHPTRFLAFENSTLQVSVPSAYFATWLTDTYGDDLLALLRGMTNENVRLKFVPPAPPPDPSQVDREAAPPISHDEITQVQTAVEANGMSNLGATLVGQYTFDNFVVGDNNRFAHAASKAVADPHSKAYNPLFIYGGVGLGKTHLMHAMGHEFRNHHPALKILYVSSEQFMAYFIDSIRNNRLFDFQSHFRNADLLLIDDIQFLAGKEQTQIEFFHTFNELHHAGKKIVISSDRSPKELGALEERLRNRFEWGLTVDIQRPNLETRIAILNKKAAMEGIELPGDVALFIAEHIQSNIRELEGALHRLQTYAKLHKRAIDMDLTKEVIGHLLTHNVERRVNSDLILQVVCDYFQVEFQDVRGSNRKKKFTAPRHFAMYLMRELTDLSLKDIAAHFGGRDHSTVMHAVNKVKNDLQTDGNAQNSIGFLRSKIQQST